MSDLFPGVEPPIVDYGKLQVAIEAELDLAGLQKVPAIIRKCIQTYESKLTRHGKMLVGASLAGKTTAWTVLTKAMTRLKKEGVEAFEAVRTCIINPKAVPSANLYGEYDLQTFEWTDGVLAKVSRPGAPACRAALPLLAPHPPAPRAAERAPPSAPSSPSP